MKQQLHLTLAAGTWNTKRKIGANQKPSSLLKNVNDDESNDHSYKERQYKIIQRHLKAGKISQSVRVSVGKEFKTWMDWTGMFSMWEKWRPQGLLNAFWFIGIY